MSLVLFEVENFYKHTIFIGSGNHGNEYFDSYLKETTTTAAATTSNKPEIIFSSKDYVLNNSYCCSVRKDIEDI